MKLEDILPESCFGTIATVSGKESLDKLVFFLEYNLPTINRFPYVILALNRTDTVSNNIVEAYKTIWSENVPKSVILDLPENRGHMFGTIDLEEAILRHIRWKLPQVEYLFKSMDDVIVSEALLLAEVPQVDFYYLPGFSNESIVRAGSKENLFKIYENFESHFWTPQTTFFILRINDIDMLYGNDVNDKHRVYTEIKKNYPNIKPWEIPFDIKFDCETHLGRTVKDKSKHCLILDKFKELLSLVENYPIGDPSHKNILFKDIGVCHYHFYGKAVLEV
jgi:hypothetical protein